MDFTMRIRHPRLGLDSGWALFADRLFVVFSSPIFLYFFLPLVLGGYVVCPKLGRNLFLVGASLIFYAWGEGAYVLLMLGSIGFNYIVGLQIERSEIGRKRVLALGVAGNLAALLFFKYGSFLFANVAGLIDNQSRQLDIHLPLGISFFTFQALTYLIDVYRKDAKAQTNLVNVALYISLFPQLIAGPIVRYGSIAKALSERRSTLAGVCEGIELFVCGLGKKLLLANPLGSVADRVFAMPASDLSFPAAWLGVVCYAFQIYFDFSGYTDMARGLGRMLGFRFPENFRFPYLATSLRDFWRRWHISLSTWFRDYLYIPLGGNRKGPIRSVLNLWIVFTLCGFWHGASWTFLAWGAMHGLWLTLEHSRFGKRIEGLPRIARWLVCVVFVFCSWVVFRSENIGYTIYFWGAMFNPFVWSDLPATLLELLDGKLWLCLLVAAVLSVDGHGYLFRETRRIDFGALRRIFPLGKLALTLSILLLSALHLASEQYNPFIYFRF